MRSALLLAYNKMHATNLSITHCIIKKCYISIKHGLQIDQKYTGEFYILEILF